MNAKIASHHLEAEELLKKGITYTSIGKMIGVSYKTVRNYAEKHIPKYAKPRRVMNRKKKKGMNA